MPFKTEGYQVIPFLSDSQLEGFRAVIGERLEAAIQSLEVPAASTFAGEAPEIRLERIARKDRKLAESLLLSVYHTAHLDERVSFLDGYGTLRDIAEGLLGAAVKSYTIRVRANVPSLPGRRQGWHSDVSILDGGEFSKVRIACWMPLTKVGAHNGSLEVVPGIRTGPMAHNGDPENHTIKEEDLEGQRKLIIECGLGSAVFLDSFVPHRAIPNLSDAVRWSVVTWMMA
ncbi:MAG: phytanoyl-CoA dioxygenase family protein [Fibrobacteria bacterium]